MDRYKFLKSREGVKGKDARKDRLNNARKDKRMQILEDLRAREMDATENPPTAIEKRKKSRLELLKEWKLEKAQKENQGKQAKKPPFYAGKIQTKATGSPMLFGHPSGRSGAVTRSQAKVHNIKIIKPAEVVKKKKQTLKLDQLNTLQENVLKPVENHAFVVPKAVTDLHKLTIPQSPKITKSARKSIKPLFESIKKESEVNAMVYNQLEDDELKAPKAKRRLTVKDLLHASECILEACEETVEPSKTTENTCKQVNVEKMDYSPDQSPRPFNNFQHLNYSPFVEKHRGSGKIRRGSKKSMTFSERVDAEIAEEEATFKGKIASFRLFLANETSRLLGLAETWVSYLEHHPDLSSDVEGDINAVAGKTKLLTSDKFKQFEGLIDKCEAGDPMIKADDLQGFHDWVSLEIEDLDKVFTKLEERKGNNWVAEAPKIVKKVLKKKPVNTTAVKRPLHSSMRDVIMAARNKMQTECASKQPTAPTSPVIRTPRDRANLRIQVLQRSSGLAVLAATAAARASLSPSKSPDVEKPAPEPASPLPSCKSILKTPASLSVKKSVIFGGLDPKLLLPAEDSSFEFEKLSSPPLIHSPKKTVLASRGLDPNYFLPAEDSSDDSPIGLALVDSPIKIPTPSFLEKTPTLQTKKKLPTPKCSLLVQDSSEDSSDLEIPQKLQLRRSTRLSRKSAA